VPVAIFGFGFLRFVSDIKESQYDGKEDAKYDAIIALTGGSYRISVALDLLKQGASENLLISGVSQNLTLEKISNNAEIPKELEECCITLGHIATSTIENVLEAEDWINKFEYKNILLVTSDYHMPRSLLLFESKFPELIITPYPVETKHDVWEDKKMLSLFANEYAKYVVTSLRDFFGLEQK